MRKSRTICALLPLQCRRQNDMMEMNKKNTEKESSTCVIFQGEEYLLDIALRRGTFFSQDVLL